MLRFVPFFAMRSLSLLALLATLFPFAVQARFIEGAVKPTRGGYSLHSREPSARVPVSLSTQSRAMVEYANADTGISLTHPDDWEVTEGRSAFWLKPNWDLAQAGVRDSEILVMVYDIPYERDYSIKELNRRYRNNVALNASGLSYSWFMRSFRTIESGDAKLLGHPARRFQYQGYVGGDQYRVMQIVTSFDHKLYDIRYRSHPSTYVKDSEIFTEIFKSLKLMEAQKAPDA